MARPYRIHTLGHSTREFDEVVRMLRAHDVTLLADVRRFPSSRKHPQWNQEAVTGALPPGIGYRWLPGSAADATPRRASPARTAPGGSRRSATTPTTW